MYSKPAFAPTGDAEVHDFIDGAVFGTLISRSFDALVISHLKNGVISIYQYRSGKKTLVDAVGI